MKAIGVKSNVKLELCGNYRRERGKEPMAKRYGINNEKKNEKRSKA